MFLIPQTTSSHSLASVQKVTFLCCQTDLTGSLVGFYLLFYLSHVTGSQLCWSLCAQPSKCSDFSSKWEIPVFLHLHISAFLLSVLPPNLKSLPHHCSAVSKDPIKVISASALVWDQYFCIFLMSHVTVVEKNSVNESFLEIAESRSPACMKTSASLDFSSETLLKG